LSYGRNSGPALDIGLILKEKNGHRSSGSRFSHRTFAVKDPDSPQEPFPTQLR
jgi:hypothetical protein